MSPTITPTISGRNSAIRTVGSSVPVRGRSRKRTRNSNGRASLRFRINTGGSTSDGVESSSSASSPPAARSSSRRSSGTRSRGVQPTITNARPVAPACATASSCSMSPRSRRRAARHAAARGASSACSSLCARSSSAGISRSRLSIAVTAPRNERFSYRDGKGRGRTRSRPRTACTSVGRVPRSHDHAPDRVGVDPHRHEHEAIAELCPQSLAQDVDDRLVGRVEDERDRLELEGLGSRSRRALRVRGRVGAGGEAARCSAAGRPARFGDPRSARPEARPAA